MAQDPPTTPTISISREPIGVTSNHRPDIGWRFTDRAGHEHRWWDKKGPAESYRPTERYSVPSIDWIQTATATDDYPEQGYYVCRECPDRVRPGYCPDSISQFIPGPARYYVNDREATKEEVLEVIRVHFPEEYDPHMLDNT